MAGPDRSKIFFALAPVCAWRFREISFSSQEYEFPGLDRISTCIVSSIISNNILVHSPTVAAQSSSQVPGYVVQVSWSNPQMQQIHLRSDQASPNFENLLDQAIQFFGCRVRSLTSMARYQPNSREKICDFTVEF